MANQYNGKSRIWIIGERGTFLGEGRVSLLEAIEEFGSISEAAKSMNMSYRKAWELVDSINKESDEVFVIKSSGGKGGGGASLTDAAKSATTKFRTLNEKCKNFLDEELKKMEF